MGNLGKRALLEDLVFKAHLVHLDKEVKEEKVVLLANKAHLDWVEEWETKDHQEMLDRKV